MNTEPPAGNDPLALDPEAMRRTGYRTVDALVDLLTDPDTPPIRRASAEEMRARLAGPPPEDPEPYARVLDHLTTEVLPFASRTGHPGYLAFIPGENTWPGALGDFVAAAMNVYAGAWMDSPGPSQLEVTVLDWFKDWIGYPPEAAGILVSGGSAANMTALACAREALLGPMSERVVAYVADQGHSSIARAARTLGFRPDQVRVLPSDARYRMRPDALAEVMQADARRGLQPLFVSAAAGATNTGAVDPLEALAEVCREAGAWLHVDAAYGGFAALTDRGRRALAGIELADSVTVDPHKWLYQPFECGAVLVRRGDLLRTAFEIAPDYLKDTAAATGEVNFSDLGLQLSRMTRAFKVWMSVRTFGLRAFREAIDGCLDLALRAQERIEESPQLELLNPASLGIVCFRRHPAGVDDEGQLEAINEALVRRVEESGAGLISSTRLQGRYALRVCVLNHSTTREDVDRVLRVIEEAEPEVRARAAGPSPVRERDGDPTAGWLVEPGVAPEVLLGMPLFEGLDEDRARTVVAWSRVHEVGAGEPVVARWETSRDFYVILEGRVEVEVGDQRVGEMGPGEFFGEIAALDWGAGFAYPRLASVTAVEPTRLLALPPARFNQLLTEEAGFARHVREAMRARLDRDRHV